MHGTVADFLVGCERGRYWPQWSRGARDQLG